MAVAGASFEVGRMTCLGVSGCLTSLLANGFGCVWVCETHFGTQVVAQLLAFLGMQVVAQLVGPQFPFPAGSPQAGFTQAVDAQLTLLFPRKQPLESVQLDDVVVQLFPGSQTFVVLQAFAPLSAHEAPHETVLEAILQPLIETAAISMSDA